MGFFIGFGVFFVGVCFVVESVGAFCLVGGGVWGFCFILVWFFNYYYQPLSTAMEDSAVFHLLSHQTELWG